MKLSEYRDQLEKSHEYVDAKKKLQVKFLLADAVFEARIRRGWSQKELSKAVGTRQANISKIEFGLANPTLELISKLANVLDLKIEFTCKEVEPDIEL